MCVYLAQLSWLVVVREEGCWKLGTVERLVASKPLKDNRAPQPTGPRGMATSGAIPTASGAGRHR
jgi:hypothetical protein